MVKKVMSKGDTKKEFDVSGVGIDNGNFIGLPFNEESAQVILVPVPWDVTVSFGEGTAMAPGGIQKASMQLDLFDADVQDAWKLGLYMQPIEDDILSLRNRIRPEAAKYIQLLESGDIGPGNAAGEVLLAINLACEEMNQWVYNRTKSLLDKDKLVGLVGGDHSVPLGYYMALSEKYPDFGILQIDAHHDLRETYEGFNWSHASVFFNAMKLNSITKLVQVGIRDYCQEEVDFVEKQGDRIAVFYDKDIRENIFAGGNWSAQCDKIVSELPGEVYISLDIDGLDPKLCPGTGTPVPGGLEFQEVCFLVKRIVDSGRKLIGFDLCEVGNNEWDANVGARLLYKISNLAGLSLGMI